VLDVTYAKVRTIRPLFAYVKTGTYTLYTAKLRFYNDRTQAGGVGDALTGTPAQRQHTQGIQLQYPEGMCAAPSPPQQPPTRRLLHVLGLQIGQDAVKSIPAASEPYICFAAAPPGAGKPSWQRRTPRRARRRRDPPLGPPAGSPSPYPRAYS
jgi:hypothetical protein